MSASGIEAVLQEHFDFTQFRPGQREVIRHLMAGRSAAAVFPTGGGKSLCYQLPALMLPGLTLVVSPLIALMKDQIDALGARGILARRLDSTLDADAYREVLAALRGNRLRLLYVAPERFNNERFRETIRHVRLSLFAVDEAHCISEWGHNFRPDYLKLADFARSFDAERILALTATATPAVLDDICRLFDIESQCAIRTGFYRPNLRIRTRPVEDAQRDAALLAALERHPRGPTIVYVTLQRTAEEVAERLIEAGLPARAYHAGLKNELRTEVQDWFMQSDDAIVVATIAFGMGVDKADIRAVYHYNLPKSLEHYSQEIGRAGRDGEPAICEMLACADDLNVLENFVYGDTPDPSALRSLIDELAAEEDRFDVGLHALSAAHDIRPLVLRTLLTYLELAGFLGAGTPFYADYRFKPLKTSAEILALFEGQRRVFLANLFRRAVKARTWLSIDPDAAAGHLGTSRERVIRALDWLGERHLLEIKAAGMRQPYRWLRRPRDTHALADELQQRMLRREEAEIGRLQQVLDFIAMDACQTNALCAHFGERREQPCGHCSWCGQGPTHLRPRPSTTIGETIWSGLDALDQAQRQVLSSPRQLARFLCGTPSPQLGRAKLSNHELFGSLARVPFAEVMSEAQRTLGDAPRKNRRRPTSP